MSELSTEMLEAIAQFKERNQGLTLDEWIKRNRDGDDLYPGFVIESEEYGRFGGSFPNIEADQLPALAEALFPGDSQWLTDYLKDGTRPGTFLINPEKEKNAVLDALDSLQIGFFNPNRSEKFLNSLNFLPYVPDQDFRSGEFADLLKNNGQEITDLSDAMGKNGALFALFAGSFVTSQIDVDGNYDSATPERYSAKEALGYLSPNALAQIEDIAQNNIFTSREISENNSALQAATDYMESICGSGNPSATPVVDLPLFEVSR